MTAATTPSFGGAGNDTLSGGAGNDRIEGDADNDTLFGGDGDDIIGDGSGQTTTIDAGAGSDTITISSNFTGIAPSTNGGRIDGGTGAPGEIDVLSLLGNANLSLLTLSNLDYLYTVGNTPTATVAQLEDFSRIAYNNSFLGFQVSLTIGRADPNVVSTTTLDLSDELADGAPVGDPREVNLTGSVDNETITAGSGNDTMNGGLGIDTLNGGDGNDALTAVGPDGDQLNGDAGNDILNGGAGNDTLNGGDGDDTISDTSGQTTAINGGAGSDTISISTSFTGIAPSTNGGSIDGGAGPVGDIDILSLSGAAALSRLSLSNLEYIYTNGHNPTATAAQLEGFSRVAYNAANLGFQVNLTIGRADPNVVSTTTLDLYDELEDGAPVGNPREANITGSVDNERIATALASDTIDGAGGSDAVDYSRFSNAISVTLNGGTNATVTVSGGNNDTIRNVEGVIGGSGNDTLTGDGLANALTGNAGADVLSGAAGNDTIDGGAGVDNLSGGADADTIFDLDGTSTTIDGGSGADIIYISGALGGGTIDGGTESDILRILGGGNVSLAPFTLTSIDAIELVDPTGTRLTVANPAQANLITAATGANDTVVMGNWATDYNLLKYLLIDAGLERVEWTVPGYATAFAVDDGTGFRVNFTDTFNNQPFTFINAFYNAAGQRTSQTQLFDGGELFNHTFDPATGFATQITNTDSFNNRTYSTITTTLVNGVVTESTTMNDNNTATGSDDTRVDQYYTGGVINLMLTTDISPGGTGKPWVSQAREYAGGVTQIFRTTFDNGTQQVVGTAGSQVIEGGAGNDVLLGGAGSDNFLFDVSGFGSDTIFDFVDGTDLLDMRGLGIDTRAELNAAATVTQSGTSTVINFNNGDIVTIRSFNQANLTDNDFVLSL